MTTQVDTDRIAPLRHFVAAMTHLVDQNQAEEFVRPKAKVLLQELIKTDDWLPDFCTVAHPQYYQQFLLHADPLERFSVVSFVWGPGQATPIHDHMVWGLIGMLRGSEKGQRYERDANGQLQAIGHEETLLPGDVDEVSPTIGDIHIVKNAFTDKTSISIHVYGGNIGAVKRHVYDAQTGAMKNFVSGYSSTQIPNLWDRSAEIRAQLN
jgi:predicted metal-dependent enzyme (double-stranded beta helix superfamily)